jgi:protein-tyrosine phosphatase
MNAPQSDAGLETPQPDHRAMLTDPVKRQEPKGPARGALNNGATLHIDTIALPGGGVIGMTHCPGRTGADAHGRAWMRNLADDVQTLRAAGFSTVLTLLPNDELLALGAQELGAQVQQAGMQWLQFPIADFGIPDANARAVWHAVEAEVLEKLQARERVLVHCAAGLGRTGTIVAKLLTGLGHDGETAIALVRAARPGTIETGAQRAFVLGLPS